MADIPRRDFLRKTAAGVAGASTLSAWDPAHAAPAGKARAAIPPHTAMPIPGLHSYAEESVAAGETIHFRTSSTVPYELSIARLGPEIDNPASDETLHTFPEAAPRQQPIHPGSYIHVENGLDPNMEFSGLTIECWVRPWSWERDRALITTFDPRGDCGFALYLARGGWVKFYLGGGGPFEDRWRTAYKRHEVRRWHHLVLTWEDDRAALYGDGKFQGSWDAPGPVRPGRTPLRLAAAGDAGKAADFFDGDLAAPAIYNRALSAREIQSRRQARGLEPPPPDGLLAYWPLDEESGDQAADSGDGQHHGRIINRAAWMIGGPSFDAASVARWDDYDPTKRNRFKPIEGYTDDDLLRDVGALLSLYGTPVVAGMINSGVDLELRATATPKGSAKMKDSDKVTFIMINHPEVAGTLENMAAYVKWFDDHNESATIKAEETD